MAGKIDARLAELGIELPEPSVPAANYVPFVQAGDLVFISGQLPVNSEGMIKGKLGDDLSAEDGQKAAAICATNLLAHLRVACGGDLDKVIRVVKLSGFVNSTPDFTDHPAVVNGSSNLMGEVFGAAGRHARAAIGNSSLPLGVAVEVEGIFQISK